MRNDLLILLKIEALKIKKRSEVSIISKSRYSFFRESCRKQYMEKCRRIKLLELEIHCGQKLEKLNEQHRDVPC